MPSPGYNPSCIERTPEPTLPDFPGALLRLPSFFGFFGLFVSSLFYNTTMPNTPFTCSTVSSSSTLIFITLNRCICRAITRLNRQEKNKE